MDFALLSTEIILHIIVVIVFYTIYFFLISNILEKKIIKNQIKKSIDDIFNKTELKDLDKTEVINKLNKKSNDLKKEDIIVKKSNNVLKNKLFMILSSILVVALLLLLIIGLKKKWNFKMIHIFINSSILTLFFILITEVSFMLLISNNYMKTDPNEIKKKILSNIYNNSAECSNNNNCTFNKDD